jgi:L-lactate dehydrogenase complex protein LldE
MRIALYVTCLVDLMRPAVAFASLCLLESAGCEVVVPDTQTCCGQPAWSTGNRPEARLLAQKAVAELAGFDYVVIPAGSCAEHLRHAYPQLLADDPSWAEPAAELARRTVELSTFLVDILNLKQVPGRFDGTVTYHDACKGLRGLGVKTAPRSLLACVPGLVVEEMAECEECCGFGGAFSVNFGAISTHIVDRKCDAIVATQADAVVAGDLGCLLNIEGRLRRRGDERTRVLHLAEILAGPAEGEDA